MWDQLPQLQGLYITGRPKPGASVLLEHPVLQYQNQSAPVIATQRYGNGRSMAITTASTWRWQMMMPAEDDSHERLWRQMLRWLVNEVPDQLSLEASAEPAAKAWGVCTATSSSRLRVPTTRRSTTRLTVSAMATPGMAASAPSRTQATTAANRAGALVSFFNDSVPDLPGLIAYVQRLKGTAKLRPDSKLVITRNGPDAKARINGALQLSKGLAKILG